MTAVQVPEAGGDFEVVEQDVPDPGPGEVRVRVEACGICHSDQFTKEGLFPGIEYPRVPGHEVVGTVDAVGDGVRQWQAQERVGVGWHGGHCFECEPCRAGDFVNCEKGKVTGVHFDGGYAEYLVAPQEALAQMPEELEAQEAAPLLCAGITTYNALRNSGAQGGALVAVQGIGGLGHLAVQYAKKMGFEVAALSHSPGKEDLARELGADHFISSKDRDPAEALTELGGARVILATAPVSEAISAVTGGLGRNGKLLIVAATGDPIKVSPMALIQGRQSVAGWPSGDAQDSEDTLRFSARTGAVPMIETFPLAKAADAYDRMIDNDARFRVVLDVAGSS